MRFAHRADAAGLLAGELERFRSLRPLVLGIPRGGIPVAGVVAARLGCPLEAALVRKLHLPGQPEQAAGAVDETGRLYTFGARAATSAAPPATDVVARLDELRHLRRLYSSGRPALSAGGHTAVIVDDGMVSGTTMVAAVRAVRGQRPLRVVAAVPVASRGALDLVRSYADEAVCLLCPRVFYTLDDFYDDFAPVLDSEVVGMLAGRD